MVSDLSERFNLFKFYNLVIRIKHGEGSIINYKKTKKFIIRFSRIWKVYIRKKLSRAWGLPLIHMDCLFWGENWKFVDEKLFYERLKQVILNLKWIIDGNYSIVLKERLEKS